MAKTLGLKNQYIRFDKRSSEYIVKTINYKNGRDVRCKFRILPSDAVLRDSKGATVWIQMKPGVYEMRMIKTGIEENNAVEITS